MNRFIRSNLSAVLTAVLILLSSVPALKAGFTTYLSAAGLLLLGTLVVLVFIPKADAASFPWIDPGKAFVYSAAVTAASSAAAYAFGFSDRRSFFLSAGICVLLGSLSSVLAVKLFAKYRKKKKAVVIVKRGEAKEVLRALRDEYELIGFVTRDTGITGETEENVKLLGNFSDISKILNAVSPDEVFIVPGNGELPSAGFTDWALDAGASVSVAVPAYTRDSVIPGITVKKGGVDVLRFDPDRMSPAEKALSAAGKKR